MHTLNFEVYLLHSITSVCKSLFNESVSIRSRYRILLHNQQPAAHTKHLRRIWEGCSRLSVKCTPSTLVSICSSPSPLFAKLCSMSVSRAVKDLEFSRIISSLLPIVYTWGKFGRAIVGCPSTAHRQLWCLSAPLHHLCLLSLVPWVCVNPFKIYNFTAYSAACCSYHTLEAYLERL